MSMKMKCICQIFVISAIIIFLSSCTEDNQIYFDEETSCIKSKYGSPISRLTIICDNNENYSEMLEVENRTDKKDVSIPLKNIPNKYNITIKKRKQSIYVVKRKFKILPNCKYEIINHSFGGATIGSIHLYTDSSGNLYSIKGDI